MKATNYLISGLAGGVIALIVCRRIGIFTKSNIVKPKPKKDKPKASPKGGIPKPKPIKAKESGVGNLKSKKGLNMPSREDIKQLDVDNISQSDGVKETPLTMGDTTTKSGINKIYRSGGLPPRETMGAKPRNDIKEFREVKEEGGIKNELETKDEVKTTSTKPMSTDSLLCDRLRQRFGSDANVNRYGSVLDGSGNRIGRNTVGILTRTKKVDERYVQGGCYVG